MKYQIRLQQNAIPVIVAFLIGLQLIEPSRIWMILLGGIGGAWLAAYLWSLSLGRNLRLRRETRFGWEQVGGQIEERFTLSNHSLFPALWVNLIDESTLPGYRIDDTFRIGSGSFAQWSSTGICARRGLFHLGGAVLQTGDPFGIFRVAIHDHFRTPLVVLPQLIELPLLRITESGYQGQGRPRPNAPAQSISSSNVREYRPGDSIRLIHWPTSARMNEIFVRQMESAPEGDWWILLDLDRHTMAGEGWDSVEEQSVSLAAALADSGLRAHRSVGLISSGAELAWLPPRKGEGQRWEILYALALAQPGSRELANLLEHVRSMLGQHRSLVVITASAKLDWMKTLQPLPKKGIIPTVLMLDPATFGGMHTTRPSAAALQQHGISCHLITRDMLGRSQVQPGARPNWKWQHTPGGMVPTQVIERTATQAVSE